jgi:hypothetical protein
MQRTRETISELKSSREVVIKHGGIKKTIRNTIEVVEIKSAEKKVIFVFQDIESL